ncbi:hypothetical protein TRAPUB_12519 [Trametes pubescens]|uniref:Uncharacterized protein n=1 Tax=Trametes pubescens TaxID=154538 RepID=A0A1M2VTN9_TRAPU|nr:hypothetical protein TRAPUB_12519 [Trametes pubescens]
MQRVDNSFRSGALANTGRTTRKVEDMLRTAAAKPTPAGPHRPLTVVQTGLGQGGRPQAWAQRRFRKLRTKEGDGALLAPVTLGHQNLRKT